MSSVTVGSESVMMRVEDQTSSGAIEAQSVTRTENSSSLFKPLRKCKGPNFAIDVVKISEYAQLGHYDKLHRN